MRPCRNVPPANKAVLMATPLLAAAGVSSGGDPRPLLASDTRSAPTNVAVIAGQSPEWRSSPTRMNVSGESGVGKVGCGEAVRMAVRPLHEFDPVAIRVSEPRRSWSVGAARPFHRPRSEAPVFQHGERLGK